MTTRWSVGGAVLLAAVVGCSRFQSQADAGKDTPPSVVQPGKLEGMVMARKPANAISVRDALKRNEGERVVVSGQVPPENVKPYAAVVASVVLLDPEDMKTDEVMEEFECPQAATCAVCRRLLDRMAVQVEVVDAAGAPVPTTLQGFRGLKPGSTITVEGEVRREGKKRVRILATTFYPE